MNDYGISAVAILHNQAQDTYHPILYRDAPLPGPAEPGTPHRLKSAGHHTAGFPTLEAACAEVRGDPRLQGAVWQLAPCLEWDGEGVPADVAFLAGEVLVRFGGDLVEELRHGGEA